MQFLVSAMNEWKNELREAQTSALYHHQIFILDHGSGSVQSWALNSVLQMGERCTDTSMCIYSTYSATEYRPVNIAALAQDFFLSLFFASYFGSLCESFKGTLLSNCISWTINAQQFVIKVQTFGSAGPVHVLHALQHNMLCKFTKKLFKKPAIILFSPVILFGAKLWWPLIFFCNIHASQGETAWERRSLLSRFIPCCRTWLAILY